MRILFLLLLFIPLLSSAQQDSTIQKEITLKGITVRPDNIQEHGDTLIFTVSGFREETDRTIEDVIRRLPGLEVNENGQILFNGRAISHLFINGEDLTDGKYAIATKNLSSYKVRKVEVLKNHQPIKAMHKMKFSDNVNINLVLEEEAKDKWLGTLEAGMGAFVSGKFECLYSAKLLEMFFSKRMQAIAMYKGDNTGKKVSSEIMSLVEGGLPVDNSMLGSIGSGLFGGRGQFNNSHIWATKWLFKTTKGDDLKIQLSYLKDKSTIKNYCVRNYFDTKEYSVQTERKEDINNTKELDMELGYTINRDNLFICNTMKGFLDFSYGKGVAELNEKIYQTFVEPHRRHFSDKLNMLTTKGNTVIMLNTDFAYTDMPGISTLYNGDIQTIDEKILKVKADLSVMRKIGVISLTCLSGLETKKQNVFLLNDDNTTVNERYLHSKLYFTPSIEAKIRKYSANICCELSGIEKKIENNKIDYFIFSPSIDLKYKFTKLIEANLKWARGEDLFDNYGSVSTLKIYNNYNSSQQGSGKPVKCVNNVYSFILKHTKVSSFASVSFKATDSESPLYSNIVDDGIQQIIWNDQTTHKWNYDLTLTLKKRFTWKKTSATVNISRSWFPYQYLVDNKLNVVNMKNFNSTISISVKPTSFMIIDANSRMTIVKRNFENNNGLKEVSTKSLLNISFFYKRWLLDIRQDLSTSNYSQSNNLFTDIKLSYKHNSYELSLEANNVFDNNKEYRHILLANMEILSTKNIRPMELLIKAAISI